MIFKLKADPYNVDVLVAISTTDNKLKDHLRRVLRADESLIRELDEHDQRSSGTWSGRTTQFDNGAILIRLKENVVNPWAMGLLTHEMLHAAAFILRKAGIPFNDDTEEAYAYLLQKLMHEAYKKISRDWK